MVKPAVPPPNLWEAAANLIPASERRHLDVPANDSGSILEDLVAIVAEKQTLCLEKRWKFTRNGRQIIIRDLFEKASKWIQKFREVGDIAVQYDTANASLPWAAVRLVLQISINDVEIFGAVAEGVEIVTRLISRCAVYEVVYLAPRAEEQDAAQLMLQEDIISLYSSILLYLAKAAVYYGRGTPKRMLGSAFSATAGTKDQLDVVLEREEKVERAAQLLQGSHITSMTSAIQSLGITQKGQNEATRRLIKSLEEPLLRTILNLDRFQKAAQSEERKAVANWLSTVNHRRDHDRAHCDVLAGTGQWLLRRPEYQEWQNSSASTMLWIRGIPGCGKTKLLSLAIQQHLEALETDSSLAPIAYFYCSKNSLLPTERVSSTVLSSILKQVSFRQSSDQLHCSVFDEFVRQRAESEREGVDILAPSLDESFQMLLSVLQDAPVTIIIDGLDELDNDTSSLIASLKNVLYESSNIVKILIASRDESTINTHLQGFPTIEVTASANSEDVSRFIENSIDTAISERRLLQGKVSATLREYLVTTLVSGASSMFLWASLHIQQLCDAQKYKLESDVIAALKSPPSSLQTTLDQLYHRVENYPDIAKQITQRIFMWLLIAERPLSSAELATAISDEKVDRKSAGISEDGIFNLCSGFVNRDITGYVKFTHASTREYLESRSEYHPSASNAVGALRCINALLDGSDASATEDSSSESSGDSSFQSYAVRFWARHLAKVNDSDVTEGLDQAISAFILEDEGENFNFWIEDVREITNDNSTIDSSLHAELSASDSDSQSPVFVASVYGLLNMINKMVAQDNVIDWNITNKFGASPLYVSARYGHLRTLEKLIELGADVDAIGGYFGTPLQAAAFQGHESIVRKLLEAGARLWSKGKYDSAIDAALAGSHQSTVAFLMNKAAGDERADTAAWLTMAAYRGLNDVVELLLERSGHDAKSNGGTGKVSKCNVVQIANCTFVAEYQHNALQAALYRGRTRVADKLLKRFPNVNLLGGDFDNAMQAACMGGHIGLVSKLLGMNADVNALGRYGSPMRVACFGGHEDVVRLLISNRAVVGPGCSNALEAAAGGGYFSIVKLLIESFPEQMREKKDWLSRDPQLEDALCAASKAGHSDIVTYLLDHGADQYTAFALEAALESHHHDVARLLYERTPVLKDYTRFGAIPCSVGDRHAWLNADLEAQLDTVRISEGRREKGEEKGPGSFKFLKAQVSRLSWQENLRHHSRHTLGGDHPQGMEYLGKLLAVRGTKAEFEALLDRGLKLGEYHHPSAIEIAAKVGNIDVVELLLDRGVELRGALQAAVWCGQKKVIRMIFAKRPDTNPDIFSTTQGDGYSSRRKPLNKESALALAVEKGNDEITSLVLTQKSRTQNPGPGPGLFKAVKRHDERWIEVILWATCSSKTRVWTEEEGSIMLDCITFAVDEGNLDLLHKIIDKTGFLDNHRRKVFESAVYKSVLSNRIEMLEFFNAMADASEKELIAGAILQALNSQKEPLEDHSYDRFLIPYAESASFKRAIHQAFRTHVQEQRYKPAFELLQRYPPQEFLITDSTLLQTVIRANAPKYFFYNSQSEGFMNLIRYLIEKGAQVDGRDEESKTPLFYACSYGWEKVFGLLLEAGADIEQEHLVPVNQEEESDKHQEDDDLISRDGEAPSQSMETLNSLEVTLEKFKTQGDWQLSEYHYKGWAGIIFNLLDARLKCPFDHSSLVKIFESACHLDEVEDIKKLLNPETWSHLSPNSPIQGFLSGSAGLHLAAKKGNKGAVAILLQHDVDTRAKRKDPDRSSVEDREKEHTALKNTLSANWLLSTTEHFPEIADMLVDHGVSEEDQEVLLKFSLKRDNIERVKRLLDRGTKLSRISKSTPLAALKLLLQDQYKAQVSREGLENNLKARMQGDKFDEVIERMDILEHLAVPMPPLGELFKEFFYKNELTNEEKITITKEILRRSNHDINATYLCTRCENPINILLDTYANTYHETEVLEELLKMGADVDCPGLPYPMLSIICRSDAHHSKKISVDMARLLLEHGADIHGRRKEHVSPSRKHCANDAFEQTPLMYAVAANNNEMVRFLIEKGADVNRGFIAPLSIALRMWQEEKTKQIEVLVANGATTKDYDTTKEGQLDAALGLSNVFYWHLRECLHCNLYKHFYGIEEDEGDEVAEAEDSVE